MKIYTKTGDSGTTTLIGGTRVEKDTPRVEAYGTIDELNAFLGLLVAKMHNKTEYVAFVQHIQQQLFDVGAYLATDPEKYDAQKFVAQIDENFILSIENEIDKMNAQLPLLKNFVIPGGSEASALAHVCRTVARRAERGIISLSKITQIDGQILKFMNRLSDYLFVLSRILLK